MFFLSSSSWTAFAIGLVFIPVFRKLLQLVGQLLFPKGDVNATIQGKTGSIYSLQHGILNLKAPPTSMWMNMGYWKDQKSPTDLATACQALLRQVLLAAGHLDTEANHVINLLDVGFGCGDQTLHLIDGSNNSIHDSRLSISQYVGITKSQEQCTFAKDRLALQGLSNESEQMKRLHMDVSLFCEDAAQPKFWTKRLQDAIYRLRRDANPSHETWLLGLDTLYHFSPSREPLLRYAHKELGSSLMAFDLLLPDDIKSFSITQRLLLRLVCSLTSSPFANFMTAKQYRNMLIEVGYSADNIRIQDISPDVFGPLADFLRIQDSRLQFMGLGIGAFRFARLFFGWWASSGIVRGCIVVAKNDHVT